MAREVRQVLASIYNAETDEAPACRACLDMVYAFIDAELDAKNASALFPEVAGHIATCTACQQEYAALKQILTLEQADTSAERPVVPSFEFSYIWQEVAIRGGSAWFEPVTEHLRQLIVSLSAWIPGQTATPALAGLMQVENEDAPAGQMLHIIPENTGLDIAFSIQPDPNNKELCQVHVAVTRQEHFGNFAGVQVTLLWDDRARNEITDALGEVSFAGLSYAALATMELKVTLPD